MVWHNIFEFLDYDFQVHYRYLCKTVNEIAPKCRCKSFIDDVKGEVEVIKYNADYEEPLRVFYGIDIDWATFYLTNSRVVSYFCAIEIKFIKQCPEKGSNIRYGDSHTRDILKINTKNNTYKLSKLRLIKPKEYRPTTFIRLISPRDVVEMNNKHYYETEVMTMYIDHEDDTVNFMCSITEEFIYYYIK